MGRAHAVDLFGPFVAPVAHPPPTAGSRHAASHLPPRTAPAELSLEVGVSAGSAWVRRRRRVTTTCSIAVHALGATGVVVVPLLLTSGLPEPARVVHAFFAEPLVVPPPPPPSAPAARAVAVRTTPKAEPAPTARFTAPVEVPSELKAEEWLDLGHDGGLSGGVEGGAPGGIVGAIVGGLPDAAAVAPPAPPIRVSGLIKEPEKIKHVDPVYPPVATAARMQGVVVIEAVIDVRGRVAETRVVRADSLFEEAALEAVRQWLYTPTLLDGVPVPVIMTITVRFKVAP